MRSKHSTLIVNVRSGNLQAVPDDIAEEIFRGGRIVRNNAGLPMMNKDGKPRINPSNFKRDDFRLATPSEVESFIAAAVTGRVKRSDIEAELSGGEYPQGPSAPKDVKLPEFLSEAEQERQRRMALEDELKRLKSQVAIPKQHVPTARVDKGK